MTSLIIISENNEQKFPLCLNFNINKIENFNSVTEGSYNGIEKYTY